MKDQGQMMNPSKMMNQSQQMMSMSQQPPQIMSQQPPPMPQGIGKQQAQMMLIAPQMMMNQSQAQGIGMNRGGGVGYGMWPPPQVDQLKFQNPMKPSGFASSSSKNMGRNKNWKGKKGNDKRNNIIRKDNQVNTGGIGIGSGSSGSIGGGGVGMGGSVGGNYQPPTLKELQQQNRLKARRYFPKKKFNNSRSAPYAPRNTTSFLIRAKKSGGITSLVSPCPVTPAVLPTPIFSPSREVLVDMAKEEWGVDGYGSMKGLIRLRSPGHEAEAAEEEEEEEGGSSESDVEEHVEVERRLDHDLSRFEMIYPNYGGSDHSNYLLENRVDDQDTHIAQLEEENLILKERLFLIEREFDDLRMRLQCLERSNRAAEGFNEEVVENDSENDSESRGYGRSLEENNEELMEDNNEGNQSVEAMEEGHGGETEVKKANSIENVSTGKVLGEEDVCMEEPMQKKEEDIDSSIKLKNENENHERFIESKKDDYEAAEIMEQDKDGAADAKEGNNNLEFEAEECSNAERPNNLGPGLVAKMELRPRDLEVAEEHLKEEQAGNEHGKEH